MTAKLRRLATAEPELRERLSAILTAHAGEHGHRFEPEDVALAVEVDGGVRGGLVGRTNRGSGWLFVELLAVDEVLRGSGWGERLMREAEAVARERGCHAAWVDTFTFQAPGFYERLGYRRFGELADYPPGESRLFYWKRLDR